MDGNKTEKFSSRNTEEISDEPKSSSRWQIIKNVIVICIGFILLFTGYNGLSMLQSTINQAEGIGVASQAIIYAGFFVSALLFPKYSIKKLGCKRAFLISMLCYIPYIAANFYFNWWTMVPSAVLVGLAASVLWSSNCTYFNISAERYSCIIMRTCHNKDEYLKLGASKVNYCVDEKGKDDFSMSKKEKLKYETLDCKTLKDLDANQELKYKSAAYEKSCTNDVKATFTIEGTSISAFESEISKCKHDSHIYGGTQELKISAKEFPTNANINDEHSKIISSVTARFFGFAGLAIRSSDIWSNLVSYYILQDNITLDNITESSNCSCGASFCNVESNCFEHNLAEPNPQMRNILTGVSVIFAVLAVILVYLFLDDLETASEKEPVKLSLSLALATCKFVMKKEALFLIPLSAYIGLQQGFYIGDFTKSYIACAWGVYHIGLVTISYGMAAGISSTVAGFLVKYTGRIPVMLGGGVINAGINIYLLIWNPLPDQSTKFFLSAAFWGIAVGIFWSQLRAFYGVIFKHDLEAAYAGFYLWDSIGYCLSFSYSSYICTYIKLYILLAVSTIGVIGYIRTESIYEKRKDASKK